MMEDNNSTRRGFYSTVINALNGILAVALGGVAMTYLLLPRRHKVSAGWTEATDISKLKDGTPAEVIFDRVRKDSWRVSTEKSSAWILKKSDQEVVAFGPSCTHLGCAYKWDAGTNNFICPCHTSAFSIDGKVLSGPAPRPLDRYDVRLDGGKILLGEIKKA
jgi:menaquinol-cytochrome c reductase iron-sulfur subunit